MKFSSQSLIFFFILLAANTVLLAQTGLDKPFTAVGGASGEETILEIEMLIRDVKTKGERLFVISRIGSTEASRFNDVRLELTEAKLSTMGLQPPQAIFATGEPVKGEGRIEFYLGSNLRLVILAKHNRMPNLTCCPDYFPPVRRQTEKRKLPRRQSHKVIFLRRIVK